MGHLYPTLTHRFKDHGERGGGKNVRGLGEFCGELSSELTITVELTNP